MRTTIAAAVMAASLLPAAAEELYFPPDLLREHGYAAEAPPPAPGLTIRDAYGRVTVISPEALEQIALIVGASPPPPVVQPDGLVACINDQAMVRIDGRRIFLKGSEAREAGC